MGRRGRHSLGMLLTVALFVTHRAKPAQAGGQSSDAVYPPIAAVIEVERAAGSEVCPDSESVFRSIARLFPERAFRHSTDVYTSGASARIAIRPLAAGHEATITALIPRRGVRVIVEKDADCHGLADALALAFVMLIQPPDSNATAASAAERGTNAQTLAPSECAPVSSPQSRVAPSPDRTCALAATPARSSGTRTTPGARRLRTEVDASTVGGLGMLAQPAWGALVGAELSDQSGWGLSLQGVRAWSSTAEARGGSISLTLWGLLAGPCYRARLGGASGLEACLRLGVGSQHAEVERYLTPQSGNFTWLTLTPTLGYRLRFIEALNGFLRIGPLIQLRKQSFSVIDEHGAIAPVQTEPGVGVLAELGLNFGGEFLLARSEQRQ